MAIVSGFCGLQTSQPSAKAVATGLQPSRLGAVEDRLLALDQAEVEPLLEAAAELGEERAGGDRADDPVGQLPAELLDGLVGERLRALGVVGAQVDVDEGPGPGLGELGAEPVDVVVVAADADQVGPVDAGREQLLLLEVGGDEDVGVEAGGGGVGGDRVGEVAGRGAGDGLEAELVRLGDGDRDDPVLEGVGRVGGVVLDPELGLDPEPLGQAVGAQQRRQARLQRVAGAPLEGEEVGVAPDPLRAGLDPPLRPRPGPAPE